MLLYNQSAINLAHVRSHYVIALEMVASTAGGLPPQQEKTLGRLQHSLVN
jgi:hypothetical protein